VRDSALRTEKEEETLPLLTVIKQIVIADIQELELNTIDHIKRIDSINLFKRRAQLVKELLHQVYWVAQQFLVFHHRSKGNLKEFLG
jgi:hypothetical protein